MQLFKGTFIRRMPSLGRSCLAGRIDAESAQARHAPAAEKPASVGTSLALTGPEQRIALVIGNSKYQNTVQLSNPGNDTKAVAQLLNSAGFEVISATDLSHNQMIQAVQEFSGKIAGRGPNTVAMVYYAGHGVQLAAKIISCRSTPGFLPKPDLVNGSLRLVDVMATLEAIPSRVRIVILDACRNNPFPSINDAGRGLAIVDAPKGSIVAYSTAPGTEALDGTGDHSPYTAAFLRLANEKNLPIEQLFKRIRLDVGSSTDGQQTPWESSSLTSDFYFFGDTAVAATRTPAQMKMAYAATDLPSRSSRQAYEYVLAENSVENYQEFIRLYPHDPMGDRIRILLGNLMQAKAWHIAVQTNSAVAYKSFYEKFSNGPYAQSALKMAAQPKIIPLSQPTRSWRRPRSSSAASVPRRTISAASRRAGPAAGRRQDRHVAVFRLQDRIRKQWRRHRQDRHLAVSRHQDHDREWRRRHRQDRQPARQQRRQDWRAAGFEAGWQADPGREADFEILSAGSASIADRRASRAAATTSGLRRRPVPRIVRSGADGCDFKMMR